jgi:hypothetical protein
MLSFPRLLGRRVRHVTLIGVALLFSGCAIDSPYARVNPFDADAEVVITLVGPDSVHASHELFTVSIESSAPLPPGPLAITWTSSSLPLALAIGGGSYRTGALPAQYQAVQVFAYFGDRVVSKTVYVGDPP